MDTQLPSLTELGQAQFIDPMYFNQVQNQLSLGNQFAQQNLDKGAQDLQAKTLANLYNEQLNPMLLAQQGMQNTGLQQKNDLGAIDVEQRQALAPQEKAAKLAKYLKDASDDEVSRLGAEAEAKAMKLAPLAASGDPDAAKELEKANIMRDQVDKVRAAKASQANELERSKVAANAKVTNVIAQQEGANSRNDATNANRLAIAQQKSQGKANDILSSVQAGKVDYQHAATAFQVMADMETDPAKAARYAELATKFEKARAADVNRLAGKPDLGKLGIDVNEFQPQLGTVTPGAPAAPPTTSPTNNRQPTTTQELKLEPGVKTDAQQLLRNEYRNAGPTDKPYALRALKSAGYTGNPDATPVAAPAAAAPKIAAPAGRVIIYKGGKPVGSVPQSQVDAAKAQGYTLE